MHLSKCHIIGSVDLKVALLRSSLVRSLVQVVEELLVALYGLLVLLDLLMVEFGLMDLIVLQTLQLILLLHKTIKESH